MKVQTNTFRIAFVLAVLAGAATIATVFIIGRTGNPWLFEFATQLGGIGNDLYLLTANALLIGWAWRKRLFGVIRMTLAMDVAVWVTVQAIKLIPFGSWALRPNGESSGGFPSGHTTHAFATAFFLTTFFPRFGWLWYTCAAAISWSRVESLWHTPLQVTAGVFFGISIGVLFIHWLHSNTNAADVRQQA